MRAHEERVVVEHRNLSEKLEKLTMFLLTDACAQLDDEDRGLLRQQRNHMMHYEAVLKLRIDRFEA